MTKSKGDMLVTQPFHEPSKEELCAGCEIWYDDNCSCHKPKVKEGFHCRACGVNYRTDYLLSSRGFCANCEKSIKKREV